MITPKTDWVKFDSYRGNYRRLIEKAYHEMRNDPQFTNDLGGLTRFCQDIIREERKRAARNLLRVVKDWIGKQG